MIFEGFVLLSYIPQFKLNIPFWDIFQDGTPSWVMSSIHDPRYIGLIKCLIAMREEQGVTQVQLATSLKKHQSYVAKIENLDRRIDLIELKDWLTALNIKFSKFIEVSEIENI